MKEKLKPFKHFPKEIKCPICGTSEDGECILIPITGTAKDGICEASPTHLLCLVKKASIRRDVNIIFIRCGEHNYQYHQQVRQFKDKK
jgi:transcription elongation factor Elf1